jgi:hypothetical protein
MGIIQPQAVELRLGMVAWRYGIPIAYWLRPGRPPPTESLTFTHKWGYWTQAVRIGGRGGLFQNEETKRDWE